MKTLNFEQMESLHGGSWREILACAAIGAVYGLINPVVGIIAGIACSKAFEVYNEV
ncbi:MAG: hypothetical protein WC854_08695 [Bacteroidales bacterium]